VGWRHWVAAGRGSEGKCCSVFNDLDRDWWHIDDDMMQPITHFSSTNITIVSLPKSLFLGNLVQYRNFSLHQGGCFTFWLLKSRGHGSEWPNFVESSKKWTENSQWNIVFDFLMKKIDSLSFIVWDFIPLQSKLPWRVRHFGQKVLLCRHFGEQWPLDFGL